MPSYHLYTIHISGMTTTSTSKFQYIAGKNWSDYNFPDFEPFYLEDATPAQRSAAEAVCGGNASNACIFDYIVTNDAALASSSGSAENTLEQEQADIGKAI